MQAGFGDVFRDRNVEIEHDDEVGGFVVAVWRREDGGWRISVLGLGQLVRAEGEVVVDIPSSETC